MPDAPVSRDIAPYRQPMVTSLGIMMGFLLNFLANWAIEDEGSQTLMTAADWTVAVTLLLALTLMCVVLYRILDIRTPAERAERGYVTTFRFYVAAIALAFSGLGVALLV